MLVFFAADSQGIRSYFDAEAYAHTINHDLYKTVFHVMPYGEQATKVRFNRHYAWFGGNQIHFTQGGFSGRLLDGAYMEHFNEKGLKLQGTYKKGLMDGEWKAWRTDGSLDSILFYSSGIPNGKFERYDAAGVLMEYGKYKNGKLNGKITRWVARDSMQIVRYKNGKLYSKRPSKAVMILNKWLPWKKKNSVTAVHLKK